MNDLCRAGLHDLNDPANVMHTTKGDQCKQCHAAKDSAARDALRDEATAAYGGKCAECGKPGRAGSTLQLDHLDGLGKEHRATIRGASGVNLYRKLRALGWPRGFQLLCVPCHKAKTAHEREMRAVERAFEVDTSVK